MPRSARRSNGVPATLVVAACCAACVGIVVACQAPPAPARPARAPAKPARPTEEKTGVVQDAGLWGGDEVKPKKPAARPAPESEPVVETKVTLEGATHAKRPVEALPPAPVDAPPPRDPGLEELWKFDPVPYVPPGKSWKKFVILIWQYKTNAMKDLPLYNEVGIHGFHIDRGAHSKAAVEFAKKNNVPYYVDHAADKGYLHLTDRTGKKQVLRKKHLVRRPNSLADPNTIRAMKDHLRRNIAVAKEGPVVAYAYDDEVSLGSFNSPAEVDSSPRSVAGYRDWLEHQYDTIDAFNASHGTSHASFASAQPVSFEDVRRAHASAPFATWRLARWMDWRSYMDSQFAACLAGLTRYANSLDGKTPGGIVGGQQPSPYGGFDYSKLCDAMQFIESYDIGGSCEILRSLWATDGERRPFVQTWFSTGNARRDSWFLWYYLLHGSRGVIAWPDKGGSWFHYKGGGVAPFIKENAKTLREIQSDVSRAILDLDVTCDADPIAVYYSHPSVQASWVMDSATHGGSWPNRSSSLDNTCQTAGKNRIAWFKILEDCGYQYNVVTPVQVVSGELAEKGYKVLVLARTVCLSDAEAGAIREFVEGGGTVVADHLTGILDEHGNGRAGGGALDEVFGIARDESKGYLDGKHITEIDGELYKKPYIERMRFYNGSLKHAGVVVYERGTTARGGQASARAGAAEVVVRNRVGKGSAIYLNLTPVAYVDMKERLTGFGETWRKLVGGICKDAGLTPRARVTSGGKPVPFAEFVYWRKGDRQIVGIIKNPTRQGSITGLGQIHGVEGKPFAVRITFAKRRANIVDLRTGKRLMNGTTIRATWNPSEALLYEVDY